MDKYNVLFNPKAGNGTGESETKKIETYLKDAEIAYYDVTAYDVKTLVADIPTEEKIVVSGGDGTLNRFVNEAVDGALRHEVYYFATGSGNDFIYDLGGNKGDAPILINRYIEDLPEVTINGKSYKFVNGVGYGIDGYCCEVGDKLRETSDKPVNYASIAIKGLLFHFKPRNAEIDVDGKKYTFKKVWLAPTMHGRYYGGGMNITPEQDRLKKTTETCGVLHGSGKLKTLMVFPSIFKGEHVKHTEMFTPLEGNKITVKFDKPTAVQVDGETILGVTEYSVLSRAAVKAAEVEENVG